MEKRELFYSVAGNASWCIELSEDDKQRVPRKLRGRYNGG